MESKPPMLHHRLLTTPRLGGVAGWWRCARERWRSIKREQGPWSTTGARPSVPPAPSWVVWAWLRPRAVAGISPS